MAADSRAVYCGPHVLATVARVTTDEATRALADVLGVETVEGVSPGALEKAAQRLGVQLV